MAGIPSAHLAMAAPPEDEEEAWTTLSDGDVVLHSPTSSPRPGGQGLVRVDICRTETAMMKGGQRKYTRYVVRARLKLPARVWSRPGAPHGAQVRVENALPAGAPKGATAAVRRRRADAAGEDEALAAVLGGGKPAERSGGKPAKPAAAKSGGDAAPAPAKEKGGGAKPPPAVGDARPAMKSVVVEQSRRYSDFLNYHKGWQARHPEYRPLYKIFKLPKKKWFYNNFNDDVIQERIDGLESYMSTMMHYPVLMADLLHHFLGVAADVAKHLKPVLVSDSDSDSDGMSDGDAEVSRVGPISRGTAAKSQVRASMVPAGVVPPKPPRRRKSRRSVVRAAMPPAPDPQSGSPQVGVLGEEELDRETTSRSLRRSEQRPSLLDLDMQEKHKLRNLHESRKAMGHGGRHRRSVTEFHVRDNQSPLSAGCLLADESSSSSSDSDESSSSASADSRASSRSGSPAPGGDGDGEDAPAGTFPGIMLLSAIHADDLDIVKLAVEEGGVDCSAGIGYLQYTPLQWARSHGSKRVVAFLEQHAKGGPDDVPVPPLAREHNIVPWDFADDAEDGA